MHIYKITNTLNNKCYVGKTTKSIEARFKGHCYSSKRGNTYLHKSIRKYGKEHFIVECLEKVEDSDLNDREKFWIALLKPEYNMTLGGEGGDTSSSPNFISSMIEMHNRRSSSDYATYGMLGKKQSQKFHDSIKKSNSCPIVCEGIEYSSVNEAQKAYPGISIRKRLDNIKYPEFYRLRPRTLRK